MTSTAPGLPGRQAEARRNDERVLAVARDALADEGYDVSMAEIARRAGVGIGTLYRRYPSKDDLVTAVAISTMDWAADQAVAAIEAEGEAWSGFVDFLRRCVEQRPGDLRRLAGRIVSSPERLAASNRLGEALGALVEKVKRAGQLRQDVTAADVYLLLTLMRFPDPALNRRFLAIAVSGLRPDGAGLPEPAPSWPDLQRMWHLEPSSD
ncbi:TetR/AcrR family transcriptional regulator [Amycolatopsis rhizosphaerae]|uniref:TetR/AcrR family transcriptional regulator n=1 Tax=Amycolatopsis rhizosphaerae TaxID=2053003 RepID=A0A558DMC6_9PSEU|nr:TetR/AcrR family transcriptional regulator [Amycolatopsis rhizosphaerae]TVT62165.1 TetR/AcrR family transcriptional regulator [Amycolatopsis rhizosphaerae]